MLNTIKRKYNNKSIIIKIHFIHLGEQKVVSICKLNLQMYKLCVKTFSRYVLLQLEFNRMNQSSNIKMSYHK